MELTFRMAKRKDTALILSFIKELAEYEGLLSQVEATEKILESSLFDRKKAEVVFPLLDGKEIGFALFFHNFSTFLGKPGLYIEDLYIRPQYRAKGYGTALIRKLCTIALERDCGRVEWWCLDSNRPSIDFYLGLGAEKMDDWTVYRLSGKTLKDLADKKSPCTI